MKILIMVQHEARWTNPAQPLFLWMGQKSASSFWASLLRPDPTQIWVGPLAQPIFDSSNSGLIRNSNDCFV